MAARATWEYLDAAALLKSLQSSCILFFDINATVAAELETHPAFQFLPAIRESMAQMGWNENLLALLFQSLLTSTSRQRTALSPAWIQIKMSTMHWPGHASFIWNSRLSERIIWQRYTREDNKTAFRFYSNVHWFYETNQTFTWLKSVRFTQMWICISITG